jgi:hypothetical protein
MQAWLMPSCRLAAHALDFASTTSLLWLIDGQQMVRTILLSSNVNEVYGISKRVLKPTGRNESAATLVY